jgi:hypothetical protein
MKEDEILNKLDTIIGLLAVQGKEKEEQIHILHDLSFTSKDISKITGIPEGTIRRIRSTKFKKKKVQKNEPDGN